MGSDSDPKFSTGRVGNSRSRSGFLRSGARTFPVDFLDFFTIKNTDQAFAITVQRVKEILTGVIAKRITLRGGFSLDRHTSNTPPVMRTYGAEIVPGGAVGEHALLGVKWFVQPRSIPRTTSSPATCGFTNMALHDVVSNAVADKSDLMQFVDLLTGVMTDQVVHLTGGLTLDRNGVNTVPVMRGTVPLGVQIFVQTTAPVSANDGDLWFETP
jgi:hypothetical protein